jgi:hypothetical protein
LSSIRSGTCATGIDMWVSLRKNPSKFLGMAGVTVSNRLFCFN